MRRRPLTRWIAASTTALLLAAPSVGVAQPFTSLTFFGDSFTDTGNGDILAHLLGIPDPTPSPPYAQGRWSNGPVWAEYFAAALGHPFDAAPSLLGGRNFAVGTARTGLTGANGLPIGLLSQLAVSTPLPVDPTGLYVIFGGALDVFDAALQPSLPQQAAVINGAVGNIATIAQTLYARGARNFLIPSLPNVGLSPQGLATGPFGSALLGGLTTGFNSLLGTQLGMLAALPGSSFYNPRLDVLFQNILADVATGGTQYGFTNATTPCFPSTHCDRYVFADVLHPTTRTHKLIAATALATLPAAPVASVPEPATIALVGAGLVGVALVRRRRAA